jgi:cytochrome c-type protein NapB
MTATTTHLAAAALLLAAGLAAAADPATPPPKGKQGTPDTALGLSKGSVFEVATPPVVKEEGSAPGEAPLPRRLGPEIAPVIPHGVADFLPITRDRNTCLDCHGVAGPKRKGEPTPLPASHSADWRHAGGKVQAKPSGARWICTACHTTRTDARPLVGNSYRP